MKLKITILILGVFFYLNLNAQNDTIPEKDIFDMTLEELMEQEVSGVSRYKQSISDVPNSIQVISRQQIKDRGYHDLSDILKDILGFDITANAGQFGEYYSLRGISGNDRFLVLINGHKLNPASGTHISIGNSISIRYADRVEIIYGSASAVYGADAFSGIINIVMNENKSDKKVTASGYGTYASLNTIDAAFETSVNVNKNLSFYLNARIYKSDGPNFENLDTTYYNYNNVFKYPSPLVHNFKQPTNDHSIYANVKYKNFSLNYYRQQFEEGNALSLIPSIYIYNEENKWKTSSDLVWLNYSKMFKNKGTINYNLSYKNHIQDNNTIYYKWNTPNIFDANETYKQYMTGMDKSLQSVLTYNQTIAEKLQFIIGIDNEFSESIPPYANDEVLGKSDKYEGDNAKLIDDKLTIKENRYSGFAQFVFMPAKIINIVAGARYDYSTRYEGTLNPRAGFIFSPTNTTKIKYIYGRAFQSPSLFYQYEQWGAPSIVNISAAEMQKTDPSWKLENQIVNSHEVSVTQKITQNYSITASAYYNDLTNLIERNYFTDSVYNKYFDTYTGGLRNENIGLQEIIGGNFSFNAKITKKILFYSHYSYTDAVSISKEIETAVPRISKHKVWVGATLQNLFGYVTISPRFKWVSDMYNLNTEVFPNNNQKGYQTLDVNFSINNINKYFRIYANFYNVLNQKIEHAGLYEQSGVYTATIPQDGFSFKVGLEVFLNK